MNVSKTAFALVASAVLAAGAAAEDAAPAKPVPLQLKIVFSRFQGEKKIATAPYAMPVLANDPSHRDASKLPSPAKIRMGVSIPVRGESKDNPMGAITYKNVGNNMDCRAESIADGRYRVMCSLEQSSVYTQTLEGGAPGKPDEYPMFRTFSAEATVFLRDDQTAQHTVATDPVTGEVVKVDITLNVVK